MHASTTAVVLSLYEKCLEILLWGIPLRSPVSSKVAKRQIRLCMNK